MSSIQTTTTTEIMKELFIVKQNFRKNKKSKEIMFVLRKNKNKLNEKMEDERKQNRICLPDIIKLLKIYKQLIIYILSL